MQSVVTIWLVLLIAGVAALAALALPRHVRRPRDISAWLGGNARRRRAAAEQRAAEAAATIRYADEIAVAARGAESTAERRRAECRQAQEQVSVTWQAYERADDALSRARRAAAYATVDPVDHRERERSLHRAARAAHRRGDLSDAQLLDALAHRNGWDPWLHPVEQELVLARAAAEHRSARHQAALDAEAEAWRAADVATAAVRSLRAEAGTAAARAAQARTTLQESEGVAPGRRRRVPAHA